jgi:hypothetical protein
LDDLEQAESLANSRSTAAVISVLAPICARNFNDEGDRPARLTELKAKSAWERTAFIEKGGWAKMPGTTETNNGVARACAEIIATGT